MKLTPNQWLSLASLALIGVVLVLLLTACTAPTPACHQGGLYHSREQMNAEPQVEAGCQP